MNAFPFLLAPRTAILAVTLVVVTSAACRDASSRNAPSPSTVPDERADTLRLTLSFSDTVTAGDQVTVTLRLENVTDRRLDLYLTGRDVTFDLVVATARGDTVWRRLKGEAIPMTLRLESIDAGGSLERAAAWPGVDQDGRVVAAGAYRVRGALLAEGGAIATPPYPLTILPR
jgi:hypothetical protein